jgi:hypothetical protein
MNAAKSVELHRLRAIEKEWAETKKEMERMAWEAEETKQYVKQLEDERARQYQELQHWKGLVMLKEQA